eukprot:scaffold4498_cov119-Isochrysis_galbana.AAC.6
MSFSSESSPCERMETGGRGRRRWVHGAMGDEDTSGVLRRKRTQPSACSPAATGRPSHTYHACFPTRLLAASVLPRPHGHTCSPLCARSLSELFADSPRGQFLHSLSELFADSPCGLSADSPRASLLPGAPPAPRACGRLHAWPTGAGCMRLCGFLHA